ncbi:MAG: GlsB/YeaQ/YmgE family stress response membrane protein [Chloroflexota bacterium]
MDMSVIGWIVVGFLAGAISGRLLGGKTARGCLPNIVVGILGGLVGGWLAQEMGFSAPNGFIGAVIVAVLGSLVVRLVLNALSQR